MRFSLKVADVDVDMNGCHGLKMKSHEYALRAKVQTGIDRL